MSLNPFEVELINSNNEENDMREALGIDKERDQLLSDHGNIVYGEWLNGEYADHNYSTLMAKLSSVCENANELAILIWQVAYYMGSHTAPQTPFMIMIEPKPKKKK